MKLKKGDHVRVITQNYGPHQHGMTGTIESVPHLQSEDYYFVVRFDVPNKKAGGVTNSYYAADLEFIDFSPVIMEDTRSYLEFVTQMGD